ncbi:MarR family winged helix-turn-helix transcriptional regulator [Chromobacterium sphagni]
MLAGVDPLRRNAGLVRHRQLREAGVSLDRALFPLIARLGAVGPMGVMELAEHAGRDHTTISRQLAALERQGLIERRSSAQDRWAREAILTGDSWRVAQRIAEARAGCWANCSPAGMLRSAQVLPDWPGQWPMA